VFSFADDLALVAKDKQTAARYLEILREWCKDNFFVINADKSGILEVHDSSDSKFFEENNPEFLIDGEPIKNLKEFEYLGINLASSASWKGFLRRIEGRAY